MGGRLLGALGVGKGEGEGRMVRMEGMGGMGGVFEIGVGESGEGDEEKAGVDRSG